MQADEAADVVGHLDVDVERDVDDGADRRDLREREIGREIERVRAERHQRACRRGVGDREHHGDLRLHVRRQEVAAARLGEHVEHADVGDQDAAHAGRGGAARVGEPLHDLLLPARGRGDRPASRAAGHRRGVPGRVRPREEADLDRRGARHRGHLRQLGVREHEHAGALRGAVHAHVEPLGRLEQRLQAARPLAARDLDAVARAVAQSAWAIRAARAGRRAGGRAIGGSVRQSRIEAMLPGCTSSTSTPCTAELSPMSVLSPGLSALMLAPADSCDGQRHFGA